MIIKNSYKLNRTAVKAVLVVTVVVEISNIVPFKCCHVIEHLIIAVRNQLYIDPQLDIDQTQTT